MDSIKQLESTLGVKFKNEDIIKEALTHRSYLNEHPEWVLPHNERLEFLGDAVLELAVTEYLYNKFPASPEGQLTVYRAALVNYQMLARVAENIGLSEAIMMSRGEKSDNPRAKEVILANACEAVVGAVYLDQGFRAAEEFTKKFVLSHLDEVIATGSYKDAKSELQEYVQERLRITPTYKLISESGPAHDRVFKMGVVVGSEIVAEGGGPSKQEAEISAAKEALARLKNAK